ncbi:MAG: cupin domain-containing protein [Candidatus Dormibacteria bacterium]
MSVDEAAAVTAGRGFVRAPDEGMALWSMGMLMTVKASAADTDSVVSCIEVQLPPGAAPPLHVHHREAELNYLLDGTMRFQCGEDVYEAQPGAFVFVPRAVPHAFKAGPDGARMLAMTAPGGIERLYDAVGEPAAERRLPGTPPNVQGWLEHAGRFGIEIVGPPVS